MKSSTLYSLFLALPPALCHMEMSWPYALRSKYNPANNYQNIDYSMTSPLSADGSNFPCKGYQNDRPLQSTTTFVAGSTYNMTLAGSATHGGGSCQLSLSYDNGVTFRVIKSMIGGCPLTSKYDFTIPSYAPAGNALLAWTWQNFEGNREYYMNCAAVNVVSGPQKRRRRQAYTSFDSLPYIWKANLEGVNDCTTAESENPVYPDPGPDVVYADGMSSSDPPSLGQCDLPTPYGQTYLDNGDTTAPSDASPPSDTTPSSTVNAPSESNAPADTNAPSYTAAPSETISPSDTNAPSDINTDQPAATTSIGTSEVAGLPTTSAELASMPDSSDTSSSTPNLNPNLRAGAASTQSTTTVTVDCMSTVTVTIAPTSTVPTHSVYTTTAEMSACTGTSASCPCAVGYACSSIAPCEWACYASRTATSTLATAKSSPPSTTAATTPTSASPSAVRTVTVSPVPASPSAASTSQSPTATLPRPPYATGNVEAYLPCVPGTFICTSNTTWDTCDYNDGTVPGQTGYVYDYQRNVSAGMECLPYLSPYSSQTSQFAQQAMTPQGYYRDDRVVRARPDGDCDEDGSIMCTDGRQQFDVCDQGGYVQMGAVAQGTTCENGQIVAS